MFFRHPIMPTKANTRHATHWKITKNHVKKIIIFLSKFSLFSIIFGTDFQVRNLNVLGKVLGSIWASISDHVGVQNDVRTASKTHHEKRCQHEPNMSPNMTPRGLPRRLQIDPKSIKIRACEPPRPKTLPRPPQDSKMDPKMDSKSLRNRLRNPFKIHSTPMRNARANSSWGMQVCKYAGLQVCRYAGMQVCRYVGM